jgi:flavin reductase (DIM6/NTAB) family NADH-FMN oxidoreductase RutF
MVALTNDRPEAIDPAAFRYVLGRFVTGVTVVTTRSPHAIAGVTVSSFNTLSLDPPLILWSLSLAALSLKAFRAATRFAVNILAADQHALARQFATPAANKFEGVATLEGLDGLPLLAGAVAHLECGVEQRYPGGDHELMIGRVLRTAASDRLPLVYAHGAFRGLSIEAHQGT